MNLAKMPIAQAVNLVMTGQKQVDEFPSARRSSIAAKVAEFKKTQSDETKKPKKPKKGRTNASQE